MRRRGAAKFTLFDEIIDNARWYGTLQVCSVCQKTPWVAAGTIAPPPICCLPTRITVLYRLLDATKRNGTFTVTIRTVWLVVQDASEVGQNLKRNCGLWVLSVFRLKQRCSLIRSVKAGTCSGRGVRLNFLNFGPSLEIACRTTYLLYIVLFCFYFVGGLRITKCHISGVEWTHFHIICAYFTNRQASIFISHEFCNSVANAESLVFHGLRSYFLEFPC